MANSTSTDIILGLAVLVGGYILYQRGTFNQLFDKFKIPALPLPIPLPNQVPSTSPTPTLPIPLPSVGNAGFDSYGVRKIYPDGGAGTTSFKDSGADTRNYSSGKASTNTREWYVEPMPPGIVDQEATGYFNIQATSNDAISIKMRGGHHGGSAGNDAGSCYIVDVFFDGTAKIIKERPHPNNHECKYPAKASLGSIKGKWIGVKGICWTEGANVHVQGWGDPGGIVAGKPANQWKLLIDAVDKGDCFDKPFLKPWGNSLYFRVDDWKSIQANFLSVRSIRAGGAVSNSVTYFDSMRKITIG